ncbi:DUF1569 domain-containing protein [Lacibacter sp. MH-610]|uniref:DUF1569 domain-containing protein n=1 Tax=Lacibacter sp. MH-610 TaxID=3020883 RepID=UPI003891BC9A
MAAIIFNPGNYHQILTRIHTLTASSPRQWGTLSIEQMLEHCSIQLKMALGIIPDSSKAGPAIFRTAFGRWMGLYAFPWPKGSATPPVMNMQTNGAVTGSFENERNQLLSLLEKVQQKNFFHPHQFFGTMNKKDWGRLIWKHLDHHLRQFNA